jgi:arylsulfatase A-like enzyme
MTGIGGNEFYPVLNHLPPELQSTQWVVNRSLEFLRYRDRTQPFFLWVSLLDPHPPTSTIEPYYSMYDDEDIPDPVFPEWASDDCAPYSIYRSRLAFNAASMSRREMRKMRGVYYGMITYIDHQLGRLFGRLQLDGLWDNTMVVFTSDHGEKLGDFGDLAKSEFLESTARVPFIVKPATASDGERGVETDAPVELADLYSTICDVAGAQTPSDVTTKSFLPILTGAAPKVRDSLYGQINNSYMFHDGRYKYLYFADDGAELAFDVERDRLDLHDLSGDKQLTSALRSRFIERAREIGSDVLDPRGELRNEGRAKPSAREIRRQNPMAWEVSHWSMEYEPRDSHYVRKGTGETPGADPATGKR